MVSNKRKIIIAMIIVAIIVAIIAITATILSSKKDEVNNAIHAVIINENVVFYKKAKIENVKIYKTLSIGTEVYVLEEFEDDDGNLWSKVKIDENVGYILSSELRKL